MSFVVRAFRSRPLRYDGCRNPAARSELSANFGPDWLRPLHDIIEDLIDHVFLKNPQVPVALQILFERLQFQAILVGHVADVDHTKIGQPSFWTHRGELRIIDYDLVAG